MPRARVSDLPTYDAEWSKLRLRRLAAEPLCRICTGMGLIEPAIQVDHILPIALGGRHEWENTQSICLQHHKEKTREDVKRIRRGY